MSTPRKRSRRARPGRLARVADQFDEVGRRGVLALWWLLAQGVRLLLLGCERGGTHAWRWLRRQHLAVRIGVPALLIAAIVIGWRWHRAYRHDHPLDEAEALARVIHSEVGGQSRQQRLHVAWATRNLAAERGQSIVEMVCSPCGPQGVGRPESSRQDATADDRVLARSVLAAPGILDPTGGATHFIDPLLQDQLATAHAPGYVGRTYRVVERRWRQSYGWEPYYRLSPTLEFWGPARARHHRRRHRHSRR